MRISHLTTISGLGWIALTGALLGCTPEVGLVSRRPGPGGFGPPVIVGTGSGESQPDAEDRSGEMSNEANPATVLPLALHGNAPNPFNPVTELMFAVPEGGGSVALTIHCVDGRLACRLVAEELPGGEHTVTWRGRDDTGRRLPSGVYFARLRSGGQARVRKLVMVQ